MRKAFLPLSVAALLAGGCGKQEATAPWLTMPGATAHAAHFPIASGDTHGPGVGQASADCNGCHWDKAAAPPGPSATFKVFTCTSCHVLLRSGLYHDDPQASFSAWHAAAGVNAFDATVAAASLTGVAKLDAACRSCHPGGIAVDHATRFKLPHQDSAGTIVAACADCHVNPADRTQLGCASCHPHDLPATATGHARVPDFSATDSALCARCHEDGKIPVAVSAHAAGANGFVIGTGLHAGATGGACLDCHDQAKAAPRAFVADFSATNCVHCHVTVGGTALHHDLASLTTLHAPVASFTNTVTSLGLSAACLSCHADGAGGLPANHPFPAGAGTSHAGIACSACHTNPADRTDLTAFACASCHAGLTTPPTLATAHAITGYAITTYLRAATAGGTRTTVQVNMADSQSCLRCHADSQVDRIAAHPAADSSFGTGSHHGAGCLTCHSKLRTDKNYGADFSEAKGIVGPPPTGCYVCHPSGSG
jgi:predicted CXXCH cytochrome family protein